MSKKFIVLSLFLTAILVCTVPEDPSTKIENFGLAITLPASSDSLFIGDSASIGMTVNLANLVEFIEVSTAGFVDTIFISPDAGFQLDLDWSGQIAMN